MAGWHGRTADRENFTGIMHKVVLELATVVIGGEDTMVNKILLPNKILHLGPLL